MNQKVNQLIDKQKNGTGDLVFAVVASEQGEIFELEGYAALGVSGSLTMPLTAVNTIPMPYGSELMFLPDRKPILYNIKLNRPEIITQNPYSKSERVYPVSVFNSPGYVVTYNNAYKEGNRAKNLPLFSYGAVGWHHGAFVSAAFLVDAENRQDLRYMKQEDVIKGVKRMKRKLPENRLRRHLENCALTYGCPAGKNFFLGRYEAPLPTSTACNARCLGCLSLQSDGIVTHCQERISFTPSDLEISQVALEHITHVKNPVVSFGQGCEGDPLMAEKVIVPAIERIRSKTEKGTIHMNTNASKPEVLERLFNSGLDSIRVSINSIRKNYYKTYFRPKGYEFEDVLKSIDLALKRDKFVSINYLNNPGFTDTREEYNALTRFLNQYPIHMIQWRNMNFDPLRYVKAMNHFKSHHKPMGMKNLFGKIKASYPLLKHGYFNPPKEKFFKL